jgi:Tfp pilus assembly protein PilF
MPPVSAPVVRQPNAAAQTLLAQAATYRARADFATAASLLERAVRIAPNEPEPYAALAHLRLEQNRPREAEQMALKAANLSGLSSEERERLWYLVAECRDRQGHRDDANEARARAMAD